MSWGWWVIVGVVGWCVVAVVVGVLIGKVIRMSRGPDGQGEN